MLRRSRLFRCAASSTATTVEQPLIKPVFAVCGHCSGYRINQLLHHISLSAGTSPKSLLAAVSAAQSSNNSTSSSKNHQHAAAFAVPGDSNPNVPGFQFQAPATTTTTIPEPKHSTTTPLLLQLQVADVYMAARDAAPPQVPAAVVAGAAAATSNNNGANATTTNTSQQQQQQQQPTSSAPVNSSASSASQRNTTKGKDKTSVSQFRGFEIDDDYDEEIAAAQNTYIGSRFQSSSSALSSTPTAASFSFLAQGTFAHIVLRCSNSTCDGELGTVGFFSNGAVVSFGLSRELLLHIVSFFRDCEQQDAVLFPARRGWKELTPEQRRQVAVEPTAIQEFSYTTIGNLPALGYDVPAEIEEVSQQYYPSALQHQQQQPQESDDNDRLENFIGYFDAGSLSCIVVPAATVEAQLPFMHALAESVEVEALSVSLDPIASRSQVWRESLERIHLGGSNSAAAACTITTTTTGDSGRNDLLWRFMPKPLFAIVTKRDARMTYLQALRLSAICARSLSRSGVFWTRRHAPQRVTYECAYEHLEVQRRLGLLQRQIETVSETVSYMGGELRHDTDLRLEWAIVALIVLSLSISLGFVSKKTLFGETETTTATNSDGKSAAH